MTGVVVDSFCGGGGASLGISRAINGDVHFAVNHNPEAIEMHAANHPDTIHACKDIWNVDPVQFVGTQPVRIMWASPDCKHFSKAKGGKPVSKNIRDLAWVVVKWAKALRPRLIFLENVEEFQTWGPLRLDRKPCPLRKGQEFERWVAELKRIGYAVEWRKLNAADYGSPTSRERLFLIARCDGLPIVWPEPTHGPGLIPHRGAYEVIDWTLPCPSIFDTSEDIKEKYGLNARRPLADATLRRIATGIKRYVLDAQEPFFVSYGQQGGANRSAFDPMHTITASPGDTNAIVVPTLIQTGYGERKGQAPRCLNIEEPLGTIVAGGGKHALVTAFLAQHNGGMVGHDAREPFSTISSKGSQQNLVAAHMIKLRGTCADGQRLNQPMPTLTAGGTHAGLVAAFLAPYYGSGSGEVGHDVRAPLPTVTTKGRFQLVTVQIEQTTYVMTDIGMRMFTPRELYRAQGFPDDYNIEGDPDNPLPKTAQINMVGNSVCPQPAEALVRANDPFINTDIRRAA